MRASRIVAVAKGHVAVESFELPALTRDQVLIETGYSAISPGTELAFIHHKPNTPGQYPLYPGYSAVGRILDRGDEVQSLHTGQRVVCHIPHASHYVIASEQCYPISDAIGDLEACAYRLASIALQGVRKAQLQLGWEVAVLGLGPIGNLAGQIARAAGATHVEGVDPIEWRQELALQCGFDAASAAATHVTRPAGFDAVIEASGVPEAIPQAFGSAKRGGHVILLGSTRGETENVNFYRDVHRKGLTIVGAHESIRPRLDDHAFFASKRTDDETVLRLLAGGRIQTGRLVGDAVPPREAAKAYERLAKREEPLMLIAFRWS